MFRICTEVSIFDVISAKHVIISYFVAFIMPIGLHNVAHPGQAADKSLIFIDFSAFFGVFSLLCKLNCVI